MRVVNRLAVVVFLLGSAAMFLMSGGVPTYRMSPGDSLGMTFVPPLVVCLVIYAVAWVGLGSRH